MRPATFVYSGIRREVRAGESSFGDEGEGTLNRLDPPSGDDAGTNDATICLPCGAVATSGDVHQALTIAGKRYSHILDPRTGWPTTQIRAVTVVAPDATQADALASALAVLGPRAGIALANEQRGVAARFEVREDDHRIRVVTCDEWAQFICESETGSR